MPSDFDSTGTKSFEDMSFLPVLQQFSTATFYPMKFDFDEFSKYASFTWNVASNDEENNAAFGMRACTKDDFLGLDKEFNRTEQGVPGSILCPEHIPKLKL